MSRSLSPLKTFSEPAVIYYLSLCLGSLAVLLFLLFQRGLGSLSFFPVVIGVLGLATRWGSAPLMFLLALAGCLQTPGSRTSDLIFAVATLAYTAGHFRLQSLTVSAFPPDPRRSARKELKVLSISLGRPSRALLQPRATGLVSLPEIGLLVLSLPIWAGIAQVCWNWPPGENANPGLDPSFWRGIVLAWLFGSILFVVTGILEYWNFRTMSREEAALFLQDTFWRETHLEQSSINRWLAWKRLRRSLREEKK